MMADAGCDGNQPESGIESMKSITLPHSSSCSACVPDATDAGDVGDVAYSDIGFGRS